VSSEAPERGTVVAAIAARNFLPRARVLAASLARVHPDLPFAVLLLDAPDSLPDPAQEPFEVIGVDDLAGADARTVAFRYARRAACAAAKPALIRHLLSRGHERVLFLDSDTVVTGDLGPFLEVLDRAPVVLTPHLVEPATGPAARERELVIGLAGVANTGVVGVRAGGDGERFVDWWSERLLTRCITDPAAALHLDQRWADLAIGLFDGACLIRDPGVNVAYWNLAERPLRIQGARITAAGRPCRLLHASGYDTRHPELLSIYAPELRTDGLGDAGRLLRRYHGALLEAGEVEAQSWPWAFERYADGARIDPAERAAHRNLGAEAERFGDPFAVGEGSFRSWLGAR